MRRTHIKTVRTVNKHLDALAAAGWLSIERPKDGTLVFTPAVPEAAYAIARTTSRGDSRRTAGPDGTVTL